MDYASLKSEITTDPQSLGYAPFVASGGDQSIADLLNAKRFSQQGSVAMPNVAIWAALTGVSAKLVDRSNNASDPLRALAISFLNCIQGGYPTLDVSNSSVDSMVRQFEAAGDFTDAQRQQLYSMGIISVSRAEVLWGVGSSIGNGDVSFALRGAR